MNTNVIYMHQNVISGKSYIGLTTKTMEARWGQHIALAYKQDSEGKYLSNVKFYKAIRKYGIDAWNHYILYSGGSNTSLQELEIYYIKKHDTYRNGYNSTIGGEGVNGISSDVKRAGLIANRKDSVKGYYWNANQQSYIVSLGYLGKNLFFGSFKLESDAKARADYLYSLTDEELVRAYEEYKVSKNDRSKGYSFHKANGKFEVRLTTNSKQKYFGSYDTEQEAKDRVQQVREELGL